MVNLKVDTPLLSRHSRPCVRFAARESSEYAEVDALCTPCEQLEGARRYAHAVLRCDGVDGVRRVKPVFNPRRDLCSWVGSITEFMFRVGLLHGDLSSEVEVLTASLLETERESGTTESTTPR